MFKRIASFVSALVLSLSSMFVFAPMVAHAAVVTWDGGGGNANFSTGANWVGDVAPVGGDSLVFPALGTKQAPINDTTLTYSGVSFTGASGTCSAFPYAWYVITGTQALSLSGNVSNTMTGTCNYAYIDSDVTLTSNISVTGSSRTDFGGTVAKTIALGSNTLTFNSTGYTTVYSIVSGSASSSIIKNGTDGFNFYGNNTSFSGTIVLNAGSTQITPSAYGNTTGGTTVNAGASLSTSIYKDTTLSEPITLNGASVSSSVSKITLNPNGEISDYEDGATTTLSVTYAGTLTLGADATIGVQFIRGKVTISGIVNGAYKITRLDGDTGKLVLAASTNNSQTANGDITSARKETTISANQAYGSYTAGNSQTTINDAITVTGDSTVYEDGILVIKGKIVGALDAYGDSVIKGTGTVEGAVTLSVRAKLAPGLSPGCLATGNLTFVAGTSYEFELGGTTACTEYDQTTVTGTVTLGNGTLNTIRYNDFKPAKDQSYTIIVNDGTDAVSGTFLDLAEGATFTVDGYVLKISYIGGDGNDVVLTVVSVPAVPDTGFKLLTNNPVLILVTTTVLAGAMILIAKKYGRSFNR